MAPSKRTITLTGVLGSAALAAAAPCDIYAQGGTPCVAAHSTTRSLFSSYNGPLYQIKRQTDNQVLDIMPLQAGGVADSAPQDEHCAGTMCVIQCIYDQSDSGNHLTQAPEGGQDDGPLQGGWDALAEADLAPVILNGHTVYGVYIAPGTGYRNDATTNIPVEDEAEAMYWVVDGTHYSDGCCFDYGNGEPSNNDTGDGHMDALYFGDRNGWSWGAGDGPWILADLENGLFGGVTEGQDNNIPEFESRFVTGWLKGEPDHWAIKGGDGQVDGLTTIWDGARPAGYSPMHKEGAIVLGVGGDNSIAGRGTFYEGAMLSGYPSDDVEAQVQADIVSIGYQV